MKHLIIEGPDGAGKTTLARLLCHRHTMAYHHEGPPPAGVSALHHYAGLLANAKRPTVFDRLHLGELVYGPLLRGESSLSEADLIQMARLLRGTGSVVITCMPPWDICRSNMRGRPELITSETRAEEAYFAWRAVMTQYTTNAQAYDYTSAYGRAFMVREHARLPEGVIGSPNATVLLVGEQSNSTTLDLPFFGTARSSGFLNESLAAAGVREEDLALTNARTLTGEPRDLAFIVSQMPHLQRLIALGKVAWNQVVEQQPPFVTTSTIPHPQYWRRFHAQELDIYSAMLKEACCAASR